MSCQRLHIAQKSNDQAQLSQVASATLQCLGNSPSIASKATLTNMSMLWRAARSFGCIVNVWMCQIYSFFHAGPPNEACSKPVLKKAPPALPEAGVTSDSGTTPANAGLHPGSQPCPGSHHHPALFTHSGYQCDPGMVPRSSCGDPPPQGSCLLPPTGWTP